MDNRPFTRIWVFEGLNKEATLSNPIFSHNHCGTAIILHTTVYIGLHKAKIEWLRYLLIKKKSELILFIFCECKEINNLKISQ